MLLLSCPGFAQPDTLTSGGIREQLLRHPVAPFGDTLFHIQARAGSFTAETRASAIQKRIKDRATRALRLNDTLRIDSADGVLDIFYGEDLLVTVTPKDAAAEGVAMGVLAQDWRTAISGAIAGYQQSISFMTLAKEIALALLVTGILLFVLRMVRRGFRWTHAWLIRQKGTRIKGVKIRDYEFFTEERSLNALLLVNKIVRWLVVLLVLYITLPVLFAIFPWTQDLAEVLFGYITRPVAHIAMALWDFLPDLITIAVIVLVFRYVIKGLAFLRDEVRTGALVIPGFYTDWATPTFQLLRVVLYAFMVVVVFPYLPGSDSPVFQGVTVFLGALFTFGSAGSLSNIIAGLVLTYMRSFQKGDRVRIGEVFGDVIERNMLVTRVRTTKNEIISIPNSTVINSHTINYTSDSAERGLIIHSTVTIGYDVPWRQVHELLIAAAKKTELIEAEPTPFVLQTSLDDFYVSYEINCYTKQTTRQAFIYSQLHENIQDRFNAAAVEIMSPHYRAMRDGNRTTMSSDQVPPDYEEPSFRVRFRSDGPKPDKSGL
jgi:small-conductance mechanosensitive channel